MPSFAYAPPAVSALASALRSDDEERLVQALRRVKSLRSPRRTRELQVLDVLTTASSSRVRNAAALALADMRTKAAEQPLIDLLSRPDTMGARATLLYALQELGSVVPLRILVDFLVTEGYEASAEALNLIEKNATRYSNEARQEAVKKLRAALKAPTSQLRQAAKLAIDCLRSAA